MGRKPKDITGHRFGRLTAIKYTGEKRGTNQLWLCVCDCGNEKITSTSDLGKGSTRSCGCLGLENSIENMEEANKANAEKFLKENTRLNSLDQNISKNNTSGVKGVSWDKRRNKWIASLYLQGKYIVKKSYANKQDAINARKEAEEKYFKPILEKYGKTQ